MSRVSDVEISLVNTNNRELLRACLRSLPAACEELDWHVTVVDNCSDDGSAEMVAREFPWAGLLRNSHRLALTGNNNRVIRPALEDGTTRYVLLLNEDTELHPGSVTNLVRFCDEEPQIGLASARFFDPAGVEQPALAEYPTLGNEFWSTLRPGQPSRFLEKGWIGTSCALVRTEALRQVGPLDERFFIFYEDTDLGARLRDAGWKLAVCPNASFLHQGHGTVCKPSLSRDMDAQLMRSRYLYFHKHHGSVQAIVAASLCRAGLPPRLVKARLLHLARRDGEEREKARRLWSLVRYDPRIPLPHELRLADRKIES
jgi:N-acetylglucosaminyl-diphospho-decaprenol L-rhamnosyltransferase